MTDQPGDKNLETAGEMGPSIREEKQVRLACPKCRGKLSINDNRVPEPGAWARCPKCRERFYIIRPAASPPSKAGGRKDLPAETSLSGPAFALGQLTVFPREDQSRWLISGLSLLGLLILITGAGLLLKSAGERQEWSRQVMTVFPPQAYGREELKNDLRFLRRNTSAQLQLNRKVRTEGAEHRIFKYYLAHWKQEDCPRIEGLDLQSAAPERGLKLTAACALLAADGGPVLQIKWEGPTAVVKAFSGQETDLISLR